VNCATCSARSAASSSGGAASRVATIARQRLTLLEQTVDGVRRRILADVLYVSLLGPYGVGSGAQN
jgi:hypothetical protein